MSAAVEAEVRLDGRRADDECCHALVLGVEQPQWIALQACSLELRQRSLMATEVCPQRLEVGGPAGGVADGVEMHLDIGQADRAKEGRGQLDDLGVDGGARIADGLDIELPELPVATRLRTVVAEHRTAHRETDGLRPGAHAVLDVGTHDARRGLRPQRPAFALVITTPSLHAEELLLDDVGDLADTSLEEVRALEERRLDGLVAVAAGEGARGLFETQEHDALGGQQVTRAAGSLESGHRFPSLAARRAVDGQINAGYTTFSPR